VSNSLRYLGRGGLVLGAVFINLVLGALIWGGWSYLTVLPSWARIALWLPAFALTLWFCSFWYLRLWNGQSLAGTGWFAGPALSPAVDIAVTTLAVWFLLTGPFAFGTYLADRDRLQAALRPQESAREAFYKATDEYAWQAADVMPFINATDTLNWTEPSDHWKQSKDARAAQADGRDLRSRGAGVAQTSSGGYSDATGGLLLIYLFSRTRVAARAQQACRRAPAAARPHRGARC
jgi:hypothetical protein